MTAMPHITGLTSDSRAVQSGFLFAALQGGTHDGRAYLQDALAAGAAAILVPTGTPKPQGCKALWIEDDNPRLRFAREAANFYKVQPAHVVAVTGTNGKTSTVNFMRMMWEGLGRKAASIGTLGVIGQGISGYDGMTTPDPVALHKVLSNLYHKDFTHAAIEASSIGLDQYRMDGATINVAAFTNLTQDHLDYHGDMDVYRKAKARLFSEVVASSGAAVLNADDKASAYFAPLATARGVRVITYGHHGQDIRIVSRTPTPHGQTLQLDVRGVLYNIELPLVGEFQAMNVLCAAASVMQDHVTFDDLMPLFKNLSVIPGRLQRVPDPDPSGARVAYVDYAHTPDALENILTALRPHTQGKLICVFGCGGDRDRTKRPIMGSIAARLADVAIITDDNPRSEDPAAIRAEILQGAPHATQIDGRRNAIRYALDLCGEGDVVVVAGKGHEQGQIFKDHTDPFDDATEITLAMKGA